LKSLAVTSFMARAGFLGAPVTLAVISLGNSGVGEYRRRIPRGSGRRREFVGL
jgi:hypothetical protein